MTSNIREKGQAVFFAAIMVMSMVAAGAAFGGAAAASNTSTLQEATSEASFGSTTTGVQFGETLNVTDLTADSNVVLRVRENDGNNPGDSGGDRIQRIGERIVNSDGNLILDTNTLGDEEELNIDQEPVLTVDNGNNEFVVATLAPVNLEFSVDGGEVRAGGSTDVTVNADPATVDLVLSEADNSFSENELDNMFEVDGSGSVGSATSDGTVTISDFNTNEDTLTLTPPESVSPANYTLDVELGSIGTTASADVQVLEAVEGELSIDPGVQSVNQGDHAIFNVSFDSIEEADVIIRDNPDDGDEGQFYELKLNDVQPNDDGYATIAWNTFEAGKAANNAGDDSSPNSVDDPGNGVARALEGNIAGTVNETTKDAFADSSAPEYPGLRTRIRAEAGDNSDVGTIRINNVEVEDHLQDATAHTAPSGEIDDSTEYSEISEIATPSDTVANSDTVVYAFEARGLGGSLTDANGDLRNNLYDVRIESSGAFANDITVDGSEDGVEVHSTSGEDTFFVSMDSDTIDFLEPVNTYTVQFRIDTGANPYISDDDTDEDRLTVGTDFTLEDPTIDLTGATNDDDRIQIPASSNAEITADTNLAPGTAVSATVESEADSDAQFSEGVSGEVNEDFEAVLPFDASDRNQGETFSINIEDDQGRVSNEADAVFGEQDEPRVDFQVTGLQPQEGSFESGTEEVNVSATITNEGTEEATQTIELRIDGDAVQSQNVTLGSDESQEVTFTGDLSQLENGSHDHSIASDDDEAAGSFTLGQTDDETSGETSDETGGNQSDDESDDDSSDSVPGFGVAVALLAILGAAFLALRRQQ